jgi:predicted transcriptional regulator
MNLSGIRDLLQCEVLTGADGLGAEVDTAVASDAMSVVLAAPHPRALLITGLTNVQSVRTAQIAYIAAIVYVRGGRPNDATVRLAQEMQIILLSTPLGMFETCGMLHRQGIQGAT